MSGLYMPVAAEIRRIAIFRALQLGDLLVAVPALRALRQRFPRAEITLIGLPWAAEFVERYRCYLDRFVAFAGYPGINELPVDPQKSARFIAEQRAYGYDLVVQMHGSGGTSNPFVLELQGRQSAGYYTGAPPAGLTFAAPYPHDQHEVYRNLGLAALLGCTQLQPRLEFPLFAADHAEADNLLRAATCVRSACIALHPGSRPPARRWPAEYFAMVGDALAQRFGARIILTGGPGEGATAQAVVDAMRTPVLNLARRTSLGGLAALISKLDLFVSNDTGPAHIAHAVDCPSITIFGPADYQRWSPLDQALHPTVRRPVSCSPCGYWTCPIDHRCLRWLSPAMVMNVAERFLSPGNERKGSFPVGTNTSEERVCND